MKFGTVLQTLVIALLLSVALITSGVSAGTSLKRAFLLHRHGARTPLQVVNDKELHCSAGHSCELTNEGKAMLMSLGSFLKLNYKGVLGIPDPYNVTYMMSNSTEYARTTISAEAVIMGLFEGQDPLPFVDYKMKDEDRELTQWVSWPTWKIRNTYDLEEHADDAFIMKTIGKENLTKIGTYFNVPNLCSNSPADCVAFANDVVACNISAGITPPQFLLDLVPNMKIVVARFLSNALGFNPKTSDYSKKIGSYGHPLAQTALNFLSAKPAPGSRAELMKLYTVGAHDWTVFSLFTALGTWTPEAKNDGEQWVVKFGEAVILEVYEDDESGNQIIKARRGIPDQAPGAHKYTFTNMPIQCLASGSGAVPRVSSTGCPIEDVQRFVNSTAATVEDPQCYATSDMLKKQKCDGNDAPPVGSRCLFYRQNCPGKPCGTVTGAIVDPAKGYACQSAQLGKGTPFVVATFIAIMAPSLLAGTIAGFYGATKLKSLLWGSSSAGGSSSEKERLNNGKH